MEWMVIAVIALIVLGPSRLPEAARSIGKGMREMRNSFQGGGRDDDDTGGGGDRLRPEGPLDEPGGDGVDGDASFDDERRDEEPLEPARRDRVGAAEHSS